jgi:hypothetical protein
VAPPEAPEEEIVLSEGQTLSFLPEEPAAPEGEGNDASTEAR